MSSSSPIPEADGPLPFLDADTQRSIMALAGLETKTYLVSKEWHGFFKTLADDPRELAEMAARKYGGDYGKTLRKYASNVNMWLDEDKSLMIVKALVEEGNLMDSEGQEEPEEEEAQQTWEAYRVAQQAMEAKYPCRVAMRAAADKGYAKIMVYLLDAGVGDRKECAKDVIFALKFAAMRGRWEAVELLLPHVDAFSQDARTCAEMSARCKEDALWYAAQAGHIETVRVLLLAGGAGGARLKAFNSAATNGHAEVVRLLLDAQGRDRLRWDVTTLSAIRNAAIVGYADVFRVILQAARDGSFDVQMCSRSEFRMYEADFEIGFSFDVDFFYQFAEEYIANTAWPAATGGHTAIVQLLADVGAIKRMNGYDAARAVIDAARSGHADIVRLLLNGTRPDGGFLEEALHGAASGGHAEVTRLLLSAGARVGASCMQGAVNDEIVRLLVEAWKKDSRALWELN